ncbi:phosphomevalonate kinase [Patescibacteria group bacterium]|nr:phosphomevalonate kinase [Patescibacteria group bacterium]
MLIKVSAPGKLFIAGEWAILEPENFGIVAAINKRIFAEIKKSPDENIHITLRDFNLNNLEANFYENKLEFSKKLTRKERKIISFSKTAIETALRYLGNYQPFRIEIWGEKTNPIRNAISNGARKIGFGFSAASTVAVVAALLKFQGRDFDRNKIFKISALSHYLAQGKIGSGFDIAASVYGGIFVYRRFDPVWLKDQIEKSPPLAGSRSAGEKDIRKIIEKPWPNFYFKKLNLPKNLQLLIGWTGKSALTPKMVKKLQEWKQKNQLEYKKMIFGIGRLVKDLIRDWRVEKPAFAKATTGKEKILDLIRKNEDYLRELGEKSGLNIETKKLKKLAEVTTHLGGAGKLSGAGGGDCGIAITFDKKIAKTIKKAWKKINILPIEAKIDFSGVKIQGRKR